MKPFHNSLNIFLVLLLLMYSIMIMAQSSFSIGGSFFIIGKGCDGVMIAAESRANIFDGHDVQEKAIAYHDSVQKIFIIGKNVLATTGKELYGDWFFSAIINGFIKQGGDKISASSLLDSFITFSKAHMSTENFLLL